MTGQLEGTTLAQFEAYVRQRLDENKAWFGVSNPARQDFMTEVDRCKPFVVQIKLCEAVLDLIDEFKWGES